MSQPTISDEARERMRAGGRRGGRRAAENMTPEQRQERARRAHRASFDLQAHVRAVVDRAPELTPEQLDKLRAALGGAA